MADKEALAKLDYDKLENIIVEIFSVLNKNKISPEEGFYIAQEILATSIERFAKVNNIPIEDIQHKLIQIMSGSIQGPAGHKKPTVYLVGQDRGWVGNPKALTEDN